ncbi:hypothetical protein WJX81_007691 [Elliptochloris bilobata]|uniref:Fungal lipase-type domain-containing protein n=1 Tax=Elliptochloris bilobata TaxID=381761 RepID=A0AAW1S8S2_9CHLO
MPMHAIANFLGSGLHRFTGNLGLRRNGSIVTAVGVRGVLSAAGALPRSPAEDPVQWKKAFELPEDTSNPLAPFGPITDKQLLAAVFMYGDLCQLTYDNYIRNGATLDALVETLTDSQKAARKAFQPDSPLVGGYKYLPSELMAVPAGNKQPGDETPDQVNVAEDSPARKYELGIKYNGKLEDDPAFFLFATAGIYAEQDLLSLDPESTNWIGYVGIGPAIDGKRDIAVAFRGTQAWTEWLSNGKAVLEMVPWFGTTRPGGKLDLQELAHAADKPGAADETKTASPAMDKLLGVVRVGSGFEELYRRFTATPDNTLSLQGQVQVAVRKLLARYGDEVYSITTTGHSLGGALAALCAFDLVQSGINRQGDRCTGPPVPVTAFTFEAPRVGNDAFADAFETLNGPRCFRVWNAPDVVPKVPWEAAGSVLPDRLVKVLEKTPPLEKLFGPNSATEATGLNAYHHAGTEYRVDDRELVEAGEEAAAHHDPLRRWFDRVASYLLRKFVDDISGLDHLDEAAKIGQSHDFQAVMCQMDSESQPGTRGFQGPLGVPDNIPNPLKKPVGPASS